MTDDVTLYLGDCLDILPTLGRVDCVITDPPYGIAYQHGARRNGKIMGMDLRAVIGDNMPFDPSPFLSFPIVCLWGGNHFASRLPDSPCWLVWDKRDGIAPNDQADCEMAWTNQRSVARLKSRYWNGAQAKEKDELRMHSNQKPVSLMAWCLDVLGIPKGATVLDPFCGSGTTGVACVRTGRRFIGIEISEQYFVVAQRRIAEAQMQPPLFPHEEPRTQAVQETMTYD